MLEKRKKKVYIFSSGEVKGVKARGTCMGGQRFRGKDTKNSKSMSSTGPGDGEMKQDLTDERKKRLKSKTQWSRSRF